MAALMGKLFKQQLHGAVESGDLKKVQLRTQEGADIDYQDKRGCTPLHLAARNGFEAIIGELLDREATATIQNLEGSTPLHEATKKGHQKVIEVLLGRRNKRDSDQVKAALLNTKDKAGRTPLALALECGHLQLATYLAKEGANPNTIDAEGASLLMAAARKGDTTIMAMLYDLGASLDEPRLLSKGWTPLHQAAHAGHEEAAVWLACRGANVTTRDNEARTPMDVAQAQGHFAVFRKLRDIAASRGQLPDAPTPDPSSSSAASLDANTAPFAAPPVFVKSASGTAKSRLQLLVETEEVHKAKLAASASAAAATAAPAKSASMPNSKAPLSLSQMLELAQEAQRAQRNPAAMAYPQLPAGAPVYI